jgi:hypothetical protein
MVHHCWMQEKFTKPHRRLSEQFSDYRRLSEQFFIALDYRKTDQNKLPVEGFKKVFSELVSVFIQNVL